MSTDDAAREPAEVPEVEEAAEPEAIDALPDTLPVLPLKETVVFPEAVAPLAIGEPRSIRLIDEVMNRPERLLALVVSRDPEAAEPPPELLHEIGTAAVVQRMVRVPDGTVRILVQGIRRVRIGPYTQTEPFLEAHVEEVPERAERTTEVEALARNLQGIFTRIIQLVPHLPDELQVAVANLEDPTTLSYLVASSLRLSVEERQELLEESDLEARLRRLTVLVTRELELLELGAKIQSDVQSDMEQGQREFFLRQQLKAIREELGEGDDEQAEIEELRRQLEEAGPPPEVRKAAERELGRLERIPPASAEHSVIRTYLDWLLSIPWKVTTEDNLDLGRAREILDEDHYDLEKVKDRIIEQLAVTQLKPDASGPILCFVGPPGVGKTSLGKSIARALGREFERISVGGVRDEAEIRGHRRTYVGAMPGVIVHAHPRCRLDEPGDDDRRDRQDAAPTTAATPRRRCSRCSTRRRTTRSSITISTCRSTCRRCFFICTANVLETIPAPLLDRMEVIRLSGYTEDEKLEIAWRYLLPRQIEEPACRTGSSRSPTRRCARSSRGTRARPACASSSGTSARSPGASRAATPRATRRPSSSDRPRSREILGPERIHNEVKRRTSEPGVATGLAVDRRRRRDPVHRGAASCRATES